MDCTFACIHRKNSLAVQFNPRRLNFKQAPSGAVREPADAVITGKSESAVASGEAFVNYRVYGVELILS